MKKLLLVCPVLFLLAFSASAETERERIIDAFGDIRDSVGALYAQQEDGDVQFLCSATAVDHYEGQTVILTAHHCVRKGVSYLINFGDSHYRSLRVWKMPHYEVDKEKYPRKFNEPETDMALFLMEGEHKPLVRMATDSGLDIGSRLVMVGYPLGQAKISYEGILAGRFNRLGSDYYDYLLLQIWGSPGSSGSSVISLDSGEIVGVLVAGKESRGLPVIFATPVEYERHLIPVRPEEAEEPHP